jgi:hypothetical protein
METATFPIPQLQEGEQYRIILRLPGFTKSVWDGIGKGAIPSLDLGLQCICCDEKTFRSEGITPFQDNREFEDESLSYPVCEDCADHALSRKNFIHPWLWVILVSGALSIFVFIGMRNRNEFDNPEYLSLFILGLVTLITGIFFEARYLKKSAFKGEGHCPQTYFLSTRNRELMVETGNLRLVKHIVEKHGVMVVSLGTNQYSYASTVRELDQSK